MPFSKPANGHLPQLTRRKSFETKKSKFQEMCFLGVYLRFTKLIARWRYVCVSSLRNHLSSTLLRQTSPQMVQLFQDLGSMDDTTHIELEQPP